MTRSLGLKAYVLAVDLAAVATLAFMARSGVPAETGTFLLLAVLATITGTRSVRFEGLKFQLTVSHPFVICALAALGPFAAMIASVGTVVGTLLGRQAGMRGMRLAFNVGAQPVSVFAAGWLFLALGAQPGQPVSALMGPLALATAVFFLANTGLVSVAVALEKRQSILRIWKNSFMWTGVSYLTGLTLAVCMLLILEKLGAWGMALAAPPCWLLLAFYRTHRERLAEHQRRIDEVEQLNAELEIKVAERTAELEQALARIEETNQELRETNTRIVEASRSKSEFLANVSHELRTPLNAVIGFSDLLVDASVGQLNERQRDLVEHIGASGEHLLNLINDILDLSKIEARKMEAHRAPVDLHEMVRRSVAMVRHQAEKKSLVLKVSHDVEARVADLDAGMFRGVLVNLLSNAVKFTPAGGRVTVEIRRSGDDLSMAVRDTGIGIPAEDHEKVFQEFYQVDGSYSREHQGTGLGLALVRKMVGMHEGSVELRSVPGEGACFTCIYPGCVLDGEGRETAPLAELQDPQAGAGASPAQAPPAPPASKARPRVPPTDGAGEPTVLLVEDQALNRKLARNALRSRGLHVIESGSGEEALEVVRRQRPDLILMDLKLPGIDGLEVTRRLKRDPSTAGIPVVAVTSRVQQMTEKDALDAGCVGYIAKPIKLARFPSQVESFLDAKENVA
jgi:signal transduction histidine kinase